MFFSIVRFYWFCSVLLRAVFYLATQPLSLGYANPAPLTQGSLFSYFMWDARGFKRGATPFIESTPKGWREPLGVGERNGVGIANEIFNAYEKGRNTNVSAL